MAVTEKKVKVGSATTLYINICDDFRYEFQRSNSFFTCGDCVDHVLNVICPLLLKLFCFTMSL
jgi:hypothetical protein